MNGRISVNALFLMVTHGLELIAGLYVNSALARQWGSAAFGDIGFYFGLIAILTFLFDCGIGYLFISRLAREPEKVRHLLAHALALIGPLAIGGTAAMVGIGFLLKPDGRLDLLLLSCLTMFFVALSGLFRGVFHSRELMGLETACTLVGRAAWIGAGLWLATGAPSLGALLGWLAATRGLNAAIGAFLYWRYVRPTAGQSARLELETAVELLRQGLPFALNAAFSGIYIGADVVLLSWLSGPEEAGYYRAAASVVGPLAFLAIALNDALLPRMSAAARHDSRDAALYLRVSLRLALLSSLPLCLFLALFAPGVVGLLYGPKFGPTIAMLQIVSLVLPLRFLNNSLATGLTACDRQQWRMSCAAWAAAINVGLNLLVLPVLGGLGACLTTLATDLVMGLALAWGLRKPVGRLGWQAGLAWTSLFLAAAILLPLLMMRVPVIPSAILLGLLYPAAMLLAGAVAPRELKLLWERKT